MREAKKLPLYLGIGVFILSVLFSAVKIGEKNSLANLGTKAVSNVPVLSLNYSGANLVRVDLNSLAPVGGIDVALSFDPARIKILPSTLNGGPDFTTSGGVLENNNNFSFSVLPKNKNVSNGVVATFTIESVGNQKGIKTAINFLTGSNSSAVLDVNGENLNINTSNADIIL